MNEIVFISDPIAFTSTFNAVYSLSPLSDRSPAISGMRGIARFLNSNVARYLYALFGKTRLLDSARLEKNDLESIPFPFAEASDPDLQTLPQLSEADITRLFAVKTGMDEAFIQAVQEYSSFRHGYEDRKYRRPASIHHLTKPSPVTKGCCSTSFHSTLVRQPNFNIRSTHRAKVSISQ